MSRRAFRMEIVKELGLSWTQTWLTILTAAGIYLAVIVFSRIFGQRQFSSSSSYDLAFVFALGSIVGRVILVRTSLLGAVVGLVTMFLLHATFGRLHHHFEAVHRLIQNKPIVVVADGQFQDDLLEQAHTSRNEVFQSVRLQGYTSLDGLLVILERNGSMSVLEDDGSIDPTVLTEVRGADRIRSSG